MPSYATPSDLVARYGEDALVQLTDRTSPPSRIIDPRVAEDALFGASAEADAYVGTRYAVPLAIPAPAPVREAVLAIAFETLHQAGVADDVRRAAQRARAFLRDVAAGRAALDAAGPAVTGDAVFVAGAAPVFTTTALGDF